MTDISKAGTFTLGDRVVNRLGYGAMQLAGKGVFGPPRDPAAALAVLRAAVAERHRSYRHQRLLWPARHQSPDQAKRCIPTASDLVIVTKIGARSWQRRFVEPFLLGRGSHRTRCTTICAISAWTCWRSSICASCSASTAPEEGSHRGTAGPSSPASNRKGLVRHIGLSNVTARRRSPRHAGIADHRLRAEPIQSRPPP